MEGKIPPALAGNASHEAALPAPITDVVPVAKTAEMYTDEDPTVAAERLLDENAGYFAAAESLWGDVKTAAAHFMERLQMDRALTLVEDKESGELRPGMAIMIDPSRDDRRSNFNFGNVSHRQILGRINQWSYDMTENSIPMIRKVYDRVEHTEETMLEASKALGNTMNIAFLDVQKELDTKPPAPGTEDLAEAENTLRIAYNRAFVGQYFVNQKLEELLADDRYAPALIERLESLAAADKNEPTEYPGLLEAIATHIATRGIRQNYVTAAMERIGKIKYTKLDFIRDLLQEDARARGEKSHRDFTANVLGAQAIARVVTSSFKEVGITAEVLAERVAEYFDDLPESWQSVYETRVKAQTINRANTFDNLVKTYARSGRRRSNVSQKTEIRPSAKLKRIRQSKDPSSKENKPSDQPAKNLYDLQDLTAETAPEPSKFVFLKRYGESDKQFTADIEAARGAEDSMAHTVVTKFLASNKNTPGMAEALQASLEDIATNPYGRNINTKKLVNHRISIAEVPSTMNRPVPVWRHRPKQLETAGNRHTERLRITYVFFRVNGENIVAIESIDLRDSNRYW